MIAHAFIEAPAGDPPVSESSLCVGAALEENRELRQVAAELREDNSRLHEEQAQDLKHLGVPPRDRSGTIVDRRGGRSPSVTSHAVGSARCLWQVSSAVLLAIVSEVG